ncbi:MAG TPA: twin-arginine translocase subunit TatC [Solirubrobacteraceae bacterium]|nr:twin-arginine translocase subunit TatC [Solirubrobacteraceae bacterium]HLH23842.1 twin-arginine translocase subunit TatC [Chloroflexota bacterium]
MSAQAPTPETPNDPPPAETASPAVPPLNGSSPPEAGTMTIIEHLEELRQRIIIAGASLLVGMVIAAFLLTTRVMELLVELAKEATGHAPININPPEIFIAYLKVTLFTGVALAMPVIIYEAFMFVVPALTPKEKRLALIFVPGATLAFAVGVVFGYLVLVRQALIFLGGFSAGLIDPLWTIGPYLSFVTTFLFWIGVSFETPLVILFLTKVGVVRRQQLTRYRKYALLAVFVIAAIITPTPDPFNQTLVAVPLYLLYELGLLLARWA